MATKTETLFEKALNFEIPKDKIEVIKDKNNSNSRPLSYISWAYAWGMFKQIYTDASYEIVKNPQTGLPYFVDPEAGIMVYTRITANGETHEMWLFVMDSSNNAMRLVPYEYQKWNSYNKTWETKGVKAATLFDVNKTLMRCLVKNMAIFGFGLNIFNGDDLPEFDLNAEASSEDQQQRRQGPKKSVTTSLRTPPQPQQQSQPYDRYAGIKRAINNCQTTQALLDLYNQHIQEIQGNPEILNLFTQRKNQLNAA